MSPPVVSTFSGQPPRELHPSVILTRHDILLYIANKIGGVHYDPVPKGHLSEEKLRALGRIRRVFQVSLSEGKSIIGFNADTFAEDQTSIFKYEPEKIDVVYLEFIAAIELILHSPEVNVLRAAIAKDLEILA